MGLGGREESSCNKNGQVQYIKTSLERRVLINGNWGNGWQFFLRIGTAPPPSIRLHRLTSENLDYIFEKLSIYIQFYPGWLFPSSLMYFKKKQNKAEKKKKTLNHRLNKKERKFANIQIAFDFFMNSCIKGPIFSVFWSQRLQKDDLFRYFTCIYGLQQNTKWVVILSIRVQSFNS